MKDIAETDMHSDTDTLEIIEVAISDLEGLMSEIVSLTDVFEYEDLNSTVVFDSPVLH